jgi:hypothetical protein
MLMQLPWGFPKNERENISQNELMVLRDVAENWLTASPAKVDIETPALNLQEIEYGEEA